MELTGTYTFDAPLSVVWELLMNPDSIAKALPGVNEMLPIEGEDLAWKAVAKIGVASISGTYAGYIRMSEVQAPNQYRLTVSGEGQQSIINGTALLVLSPDPDNTQKTLLNWNAEANISGKLAGVGQRLIKSAAGMLSKQFFNGLARQIPSTAQPQ
jgi:uncharacterized protein